MSTPTIVTGDDVSISVELQKNELTFNIPTDAVVKARLVSTGNTKVYSGEVAQSSSATGADWANSLVVVEMVPSDTSGISHQGAAELEIQVDDGKKTTWFATVEIVRGHID